MGAMPLSFPDREIVGQTPRSARLPLDPLFCSELNYYPSVSLRLATIRGADPLVRGRRPRRPGFGCGYPALCFIRVHTRVNARNSATILFANPA
jgi:hypothetical protein